MIDLRLTRQEWNFLFDEAQKLSLDPADFDRSDEEDPHALGSRLVHRPTGYWINLSGFENASGHVKFSTRWSPLVDGEPKAYYDTRTRQLVLAVKWLMVVKQEHETVDRWQAAVDDRAVILDRTDDDERPFSKEEQRLLLERLDQFEEKMIALVAPSGPAATQLHETIAHAKDAAGRLSRHDWKMLFAGALLKQIVGLGLTSDAVHQMMHYASIYVGPLIASARHFLS